MTTTKTNKISKTSFVHISGRSSIDDGLWARATNDESVFAVYEFAYWADLDESAIPTRGQYNVQCGYVDLGLVKAREDALRSCGWCEHTGLTFVDGVDVGDIWEPYSGDIIAKAGTPAHTWCIVDAMWSYGARDVVDDASGNNRAALIRHARRAL